MKCLVVIAHPILASLCGTMARTAIATLTGNGHEVEIEDLYRVGFSPVLTAAERQSFYRPPFDTSGVQPQVGRLLAAEALVLVFPTWWFGFPAMLQGWFDRAWAPGIAYEYAVGIGPIKPKLHRLRRVLAITSLGSAWWVDHLVLRQPVKRTLRFSVLATCAPACRFEMLSLYRSELADDARVQTFCKRIEKTLLRWS